jgi:hypothetical protein
MVAGGGRVQVVMGGISSGPMILELSGLAYTLPLKAAPVVTREFQMFKHVIAATLLTIPLCGHSQSYADSPFYKPSAPVPATAHVQGWSHGSIKANGVVIDLSELVSASAPGFEEIRGWSVASHVDGTKPAQIFHFYIQYDSVDVTFGYDLLAEPVEGTERIKCTFTSLTDPPFVNWWPRNKAIDPVALSSDLTPLVINSGDTISIKLFPLGQDKVAVIEYLQLTLVNADTVSLR